MNLAQGKNLVGAYWQPAAVLCDTDYWRTLPEREWRNGTGKITRDGRQDAHLLIVSE